MNYEQLQQWVSEHDACADSVQWLQESHLNAQDAWNTCPNAPWMLWALVRLPNSQPLVTRGLLACFEFTTRYYTPEGLAKSHYDALLRRLRWTSSVGAPEPPPLEEPRWGYPGMREEVFYSALLRATRWILENPTHVDLAAHSLRRLLPLSAVQNGTVDPLAQALREAVSFEQVQALL